MEKPLVSDLNLKLGLQAVMDSIEFVETSQQNSNRIHCTQCQAAIVFYHAGECEHEPVVCSNCYENSDIKTCKDCGQVIQDVCREDSQFLDSTAFCRLKKDGCEAVFPLRHILQHEDECHPSVDPIKQVTNNRSKRLDSVGSFKQQVKEDDADLRKLIEDLRKKFNEYEKCSRENRAVEKLTNQLALMEEKLNREIAAKKEMEKRLLDQTKRKSDVIKQELLRHITDQLNQQVDKQIKESEIRFSNQASAAVEKLKQEVVKVVTVQVNKQVERQVLESRKKIAEQLIPRTDSELQKLAKKAEERMEQHFEKQFMDFERKMLKNVSKKADIQKIELSKNITEQVSQQTEKKLRMSAAMTSTEVSRKAELTRLVRENRSLQVEKKKTNEMTKNIRQITTKEIHKDRKATSESSKEIEILNLVEDAADGQKPENFLKLSKELSMQVESQSQETKNDVMAKLQATSKDLGSRMEKCLLEQVVHAAEKQAQGIHKQCEVLVSEQIKKGMSEIKDHVAKSVELEMGKQVAELQKMFGKELKAQKQQLEQANQQFVGQLSASQDSNFIELKKAAEKDREDFQKLVELKFSLHLKNHAAEVQKRMVEELKVHKQDLFTANQKFGVQLQEMHDLAGKNLTKKYEADKDKLLRCVDERVIQQSKVNETELQKRIAKELKLQRLEMVQENQQVVAQLHDDQGNAMKQLKQKIDVDNEKWMKYFEERLNQQMKTNLNVLSKQMLQEKQELMQANLQSINQIMGLQDAGARKYGKKLEAQKQIVLADFKNQLFEQLETRIAALQQEMDGVVKAAPKPQEDITAARNDLMQYVDQRVREAREELAKGLQEVVQTAVNEGILHLGKDAARIAGDTVVDGPVVNGTVPATALDHDEFKREIISEIEDCLLEKFQGTMNGKCERCSPESAKDGEEGRVNGEDDGPVQNPAVNGNHGRSANGGPGRDMSHFEHFEAMQRKIFNKQFGKLVNEAHAKIMAVVNELSVPKREEMVTEVALRVNERLEDIQKILLNRLDEEILMQKREVLTFLEDRLGNAREGLGLAVGDGTEISNNFHPTASAIAVELEEVHGQLQDAQATPLKEWHEESSKLMPQGHLLRLSSVDHKEEIRRLVKEEMSSYSVPEDSVVGPNDGATTYVWRITNFRKKFEGIESGITKQLASNEFTVQGTPLKLKAHLMSSQLVHWLSLVMGFVKADGAEETATKSMHSHKRTFVLVDQSQAPRRRDRVIVREPGFRDEGVDKWMSRFYGPVCFVPVEALREGSIYVKNDTAIIKIMLEPSHTLYRGMRNDDGVLFWKIDNYGAKKRAEVEGLAECLYSDYFSTGPKGYRMQVRAYLNGDDQGKSEHLSIYLYFRRGQHDEFIAATFPHTVTFTVLEQTESGEREDISKTMESDGHILSAYGFREFALQSEIETPDYLRNDTLLIKVEVAPLLESRNSFLYG